MTKKDYILRRFAKISHKRWESFVISRIIHGIDDREIEFVTQQCVRFADGTRALTDLFFPQFNIHLEIDEPHHYKQSKADLKREQDIILATGHQIERLIISDGKGGEKEIDLICSEVDSFISLIKRLKTAKIAKGDFLPWDLDERYSSEIFIKRGYIDREDNVTFRVQVEALRCLALKVRAGKEVLGPSPTERVTGFGFPVSIHILFGTTN